MRRALLRVLLPRPFWSERAAYEHAFHEQLATPTSLSESAELAWLFGERRRLAETGSAPTDVRLRAADQRFRSPSVRLAVPRVAPER